MTLGQVEQARIEETQQLLDAGDPQAVTRLREMLFDVRRGACAVSGTQAVSLARWAFQLELWDDALEWATRALDDELDADECALAHTLVITVLYRQSRFANALAAVAATREVPDATSPLRRLQLELVAAQVEEKMGLLEQALERQNRAQQWAENVDGELRAAYEGTRGTTLNELGKNEEAVAAYERALGFAAESAPTILLNLGNALRELGRGEEAERRYEQALERGGGNSAFRGAVLSNHARLLVAQDDLTRAKAMLRDAFQLRKGVDPAGAAISAEELAKLYVREEDYEWAAHWAEVASALRDSTGQPEDPWLEQFRARMRAVGRALADRPDIEGHILLERMRQAGFAEWAVVLRAPAEAVIRCAIAELTQEVDSESGRAVSVQDGWLLALLHRVLEVGRQLALAEHTERMADAQSVVHAALDVIRQELWLERKRRYEARRQVLERQFALDAIRAVLMPHAARLGLDAASIEALEALIRRSMLTGLDVAFAELPEAHPGELINRLVNVGTWRESLGLVEAHPSLLGDPTIDLLHEAAASADPAERKRIWQHLRVLRRCRAVGPARAFGEAPSADGRPLGLKAVLEPAGLDPELPRALEVVYGEQEADPDALEHAAETLARAGRPDHARAAFRRLGQTRLTQADGDRASALAAAARAFQRAIEIGATGDDAMIGGLMLELGSTLLERWRIDESSVATLLGAHEAFEGALRRSPVRLAPRRALDAARGVTDTVTALLPTLPDRSKQVFLRQVKIEACRAAIAATDWILLAGEAGDPTDQLERTLWAYHGAVEELCALGFWGGALAAAEHGRARGFLAQIDRLGAVSGENQVGGEIPTTADHLITFLTGRAATDVLLAWYMAGRTCYAFALRGGSHEVRGAATGLDAHQLEMFGRLAADSVWQRPADPNEPLSPAWSSLMDSLIPPDLRDLVEEAEQIILVPHGPVAKLPVHALPVGRLAGRCLVDVADVRYLPGVAVANRLRGRVPGGDVAVVLSYDGDGRETESEFDRESREVAAIVGCEDPFIGNAARPQCLFDRGSRARLIHIAAHGSFDAADPLASGLVLSDGHGGDSRLSARDVARLPELPGALVVLSGCETSRQSVDLTGEGLGLVRAFLLVGARAVVASQWLVDSSSTRMLMERFHSELHASGDVAGSLRRAMLSARQSASHPYYWAPFVAVEALP